MLGKRGKQICNRLIKVWATRGLPKPDQGYKVYLNG